MIGSLVIIVMPDVLQGAISVLGLIMLALLLNERRRLRKSAEEMNRMLRLLSVASMEQTLHRDD